MWSASIQFFLGGSWLKKVWGGSFLRLELLMQPNGSKHKRLILNSLRLVELVGFPKRFKPSGMDIGKNFYLVKREG